MDFQVNGKSLDKALGTGASEILQDVVLHKSRIFVVERNQFSALAQEHQLQYSGLTDDNTAIAIGKITGAEYVVLGSINAMGNTIVLAARIVNVEQALVLHSFRIPSQNGINGLYTTLENLGNRVATVLAETKIAPLRQQPTPFPEKAPLSRVTPTPKPQARKIPPSSSASPTPLPINPKELFSEGMFNRGKDFYYGRNGKKKDYPQAAQWYRKAAEQGHAGAQTDLGYMYEKGYGVPKNLKTAAEWYARGARSGSPVGQCNLGYMYEKGRGVAQNHETAAYWYRKAAEQGNLRGQCNLAYMYEKGYGVPQSYDQAVYWYRKAAERNDARGEFSLGWMYEKGRGVPQSYAEAAYWYQRAGNQGYASAENNLGCLYEAGNGVPRDYAKAISWYRKAADHGNEYGMFNLGEVYENGTGTSKNLSAAISWYRKAAEKGHSGAKKALTRLGQKP